MNGDALLYAVETITKSWIMDSGASFHACYSRECEDNPGNKMDPKGCEVYPRSEENADIGGCRKYGTLYMVEVTDSEVNAIEEEEKTFTLWHQRLGHMSEKGMKILASKGSIPDLKKKKVSFLKSGNSPKAGKLELIHSDVYDHTSVSSVGGARYYVTFIEDCTRKIKCFTSDNGGEYSSKEFVDFCARNVIRMMKMIPKNPQQIGVATRMNRTLCERAQSMRLHGGLPKMFWDDAVNTAAYLINRGPSVPLGFKILEEVWTGRPATLKHLRVIGCIFYVKIKDSERDKLESKARRCTFIGYGGDEMGYRFWDNENKCIIRSRDIVFNEQAVYKYTFTGGSGNLEEPVKMNDQVEFEAREEEEDPVATAIKHSTRLCKPPIRYGSSVNYLLLTVNGKIELYPEGLGMNNSIQWKKVMEEEMKSLDKNKTWFLFKLPNGKKALQNKWSFRVKYEIDGIKRYKARLEMTTIRLVVGIMATEDLHLEQMDVKTAFCHGDLEEDIYMMQPEGFPVVGKENLSGYNKCEMDHCCYQKKFDSSYIILLLYVDDMLIAGSDIQDINKLKNRNKENGTLKLSQTKYMKKVFEKFSMADPKPRSMPLGSQLKLSKAQSPKTEKDREQMAKVPYASTVGSLMYAMVCTRPDIAQAVEVISRFMSNPGKDHWEGVKWLLRYLNGTSDVCVVYRKKEAVLEGFIDANLGGCEDSGKSTTGFVFIIGVHLAKNPVFHSRTKQIQMQYHFIRELITNETVNLQKILGTKNPADMYTKVVTTDKLRLCMALTGLPV
ncbi:hypothetical protein LXL04_023736 [Taraxacum kok-saghyz]